MNKSDLSFTREGIIGENMNTPREAEIQGHLAVLKDALNRCNTVLSQGRVQEADLHDGLTFLKLAHADAEYGLVDFEREDWQKLRSDTIINVAQLLKGLRVFNPDLTTWERARDPTILVQGRDTRSGTRRSFDYPRIKSVYEEVRKKIWEKITEPRTKGARAPPSESLPRDQNAEHSREPEEALIPENIEHPPVTGGNSEPANRTGFPYDVHRHRSGRRKNVRAPPSGTLRDMEGPPGGRFLMNTTSEDASAWEDRGYDGKNKQRNKYRKDQKYGHQENDLDFFRGVYQDEVNALQKLNLGDDFRYPSDEAFARYFPEFDFVKAMKGNSLRKWDGTVRDYPSFKPNYYRMILCAEGTLYAQDPSASR